jgi:hypothetical protein
MMATMTSAAEVTRRFQGAVGGLDHRTMPQRLWVVMSDRHPTQPRVFRKSRKRFDLDSLGASAAT